MKVSGKNLGGATLGQQTGSPLVQLPPHPFNVLLFGKRPAPLVDPRQYPHLRRGKKKLELIKEQISDVLGVPDEAFSVELCEGQNASISRDGEIRFGVELLEEREKDDDLLVAVMGHEIGHQPWEWPEGDLSGLKQRELDELYREEEAKADRFAGRVLADLGLSPDSVRRFLLAHARFEGGKPREYYPAEERVQHIEATFERRRSALQAAARLSPRIGQRRRDLR